MSSSLFKTKSIEQLVVDVERSGKALKRSLSAWDLTLLGIRAIIGTGIFALTGTAAANAGPAMCRCRPRPAGACRRRWLLAIELDRSAPVVTVADGLFLVHMEEEQSDD